MPGKFIFYFCLDCSFAPVHTSTTSTTNSTGTNTCIILKRGQFIFYFGLGYSFVMVLPALMVLDATGGWCSTLVLLVLILLYF